jgi:hypothetical protein
MSAVSIPPNHAFDAVGSNRDLGADRLAHVPEVSASHQVDGFAMQGQSSFIENVGVGARKGKLMAGRSVSGELVFWLDRPGKQRLLRGAGGKPVTHILEARAAARKAIAATNGRASLSATATSQATGPPALETPERSKVQGVKMVTGYDRVNRQMRRGELVTVSGATGQPAFWLRGVSTDYALRAPDGQPITDRRLAEARADQLIGNGAAMGLREVHLSAPSGAEVKTPADRTSPGLVIDLESPTLNAKGGQGEARFGLLATRLGSKGSALTCDDAVNRARAMGIEVRVTNENAEGAPENANLHAWVQLSNDRIGGSQFANFTHSLSAGEPDLSATSYKLPANASAAFAEGYDQASRQIGVAIGARVLRSVAEGKAATSTARSDASISARVRSAPVVPTGRPVRSTQPPVARSWATLPTPSPVAKPAASESPSKPGSAPQTGKGAEGGGDGGGRQAGGTSPKKKTLRLTPPTNPSQSAGSTRSSPPKALSLLDSQTENSVSVALQDLPTMINGSPAWQGHCASYSGVVAKRIAGVDMQTPLQRGKFKPVAADNIEAQLATFGPNRQGLVRVGNRGHQFNWVTNNKGRAIFVDATTGRVGTKLSDITVGLPPKLVTGDIQVNAFDLPHLSATESRPD